MYGWVKLSRDVIETELWKEVVPFRLYLLLLMQANRTEGRMVNGIQLKKGQYIRAFSKLAEDLGYREGRGEKRYSKSTIKRAVDKLVKKRLISVEDCSVGTLFTLLGYEDIQDNGFVDFFCAPFRETSSKRIENEVKTSSEQKQEREKKEEKGKMDDCAQMNNQSQYEQENSKIKSLEKRFLELRQKGRTLSIDDKISIENLVKLDVPCEQLLLWMDEIHENYQKSSRKGTINSMKYYEAAILTKLAKKNSQKKTSLHKKETIEERIARLEQEGKLS